MTIYLGQFQEITGINSDLAGLSDFHNIGYYNGDYYWAESDSSNLYIKKVSGLYGSTSTEHTKACTPTNSTQGKQARLRVLYVSGKWYLLASLLNLYTYNPGTLTFRVTVHTIFKNLTDGGSYVDDSVIVYETPNATNFLNSFSAFTFGSTNMYIMWKYSAATSNWKFVRCDLSGSTTALSAAISSAFSTDNSTYPGTVLGSLYRFGHYIGSTFYIRSFSSSEIISDTESTTELTPPSSFNENIQLFTRQGNYDQVIDYDHYYYRNITEDIWASITDTGTDTNGIIWKYDSFNRLKMAFSVWMDSAFKISAGGGVVRIQSFTDDAYVGFETDQDKAWISSGGSTMQQYDLLQTKNTTTYNIFQGVVNFNQGTMNIVDTTTYNIWESNDYLDMWIVHDTTTYQIFSGFVMNNSFDRFRTIQCEAAWIRDLMANKVTASYTTTTAFYILTDIIENNCAFCVPDIASSSTTYSISFRNKTVKDIIRTMAQFEGWISYITPELVIKANDGTTDSGIDIFVDLTTTNDLVYDLTHTYDQQQVSVVELLGGYVGTSRLKSVYKTSVFGFARYFDNYPEITTTAELDALAEQIGIDKDTGVFQVSFKVVDKPPLQWGEQIDFLYSPLESTKSELGAGAKYFTNKAEYDIVSNIGKYVISDVRIVEKGSGENEDGVSSANDQQLLDQLAS